MTRDEYMNACREGEMYAHKRWRKCIVDIKSDILKITDGLVEGFDLKTEIFEIIDRHVNELRGE